MRIETLSNHPRSQVLALAAELATIDRRRAEHLDAWRRLRKDNAAARRWWQWRHRRRHRRQERRMLAEMPRLDPAVHADLARQQAGMAAEDRAAWELTSHHGDDWMLYQGYQNRRGEVDLVAVGPGGIWAVEVKGRAVRVHVHGDDWTFEKFDRYGNRVDRGVLCDRTQRSWGRQVGDIAAELSDFLAKRGVAVPVRTAVVVMHDRAEIGSCVDMAVDHLSVGIGHLARRMSGAGTVLSREQQAKAEQLIRKDHLHNEQRRRRR